MYGEDLAYIHDQGYSSGVKQAASFILQILRSTGPRHGCIVDFGCGSGRSTAVFARAGYDAIGIDRSPAMVRLAERQAPAATFMVDSFPIPSDTRLDAIVAIGEVVNYLPSHQSLRRLIRLAFSTLQPGGLLVFDIRAIPLKGQARQWITGRTGKDWAVIAASCIASKRPRLTRKITTFRKVHGQWRRDEETHRQWLYRPVEIHDWLRSEGFRVQMRRRYGRTQISPGGRVFVARKPLSP